MRYDALLFILFFSLTTQCQSVKNLNDIPNSDKLLSYERTPCFGWCQTYEVTVLKDGKGYFVGKNYVPFLDTTRFTLPDKTLKQIKAILQHPDYLNLTIEKPEYQVTDIPGLNFSDFKNDRKYTLDMVIPKPIEVMADKIDKELEKEKLIYNKETYPMVRQEILIELKPDTDPYSLDGKDTFYQLSYRDEVGSHIYKYEMFCPAGDVDKALKAVKQRKGVRETQINHKLERR